MWYSGRECGAQGRNVVLRVRVWCTGQKFGAQGGNMVLRTGNVVVKRTGKWQLTVRDCDCFEDRNLTAMRGAMWYS